MSAGKLLSLAKRKPFIPAPVMKKNKGFHAVRLGFNRRAVIASASVTRRKNVFHSLAEIDITEPRQRMKDYFDQTGTKLSMTAYIVACLSKVIRDHPRLNAFITGNRFVFLDDITISVLIERDLLGEKVPEPIAIAATQNKSLLDIQAEIREAQTIQDEKLGSLTGSRWFSLIPGFLMKTFVRLADKNIYMARRYGKLSVTSVGMFSREPVWFIPHGSATVLLTVGSISEKAVLVNEHFESRKHLCITASFDHDVVDGAPAARFINQLAETIQNGMLIPLP